MNTYTFRAEAAVDVARLMTKIDFITMNYRWTPPCFGASVTVTGYFTREQLAAAMRKVPDSHVMLRSLLGEE